MEANINKPDVVIRDVAIAKFKDKIEAYELAKKINSNKKGYYKDPRVAKLDGWVLDTHVCRDNEYHIVYHSLAINLATENSDMDLLKIEEVLPKLKDDLIVE